jgi:hypothetical protein
MRLTTILTALAAALTLAPAGSALAAQGVLSVSGNRYVNPGRGCYTGRFWPLAVNNQTNTPVLVFADKDCAGHLLGPVRPGQSQVFEFGGSVFVPR